MIAVPPPNMQYRGVESAAAFFLFFFSPLSRIRRSTTFSSRHWRPKSWSCNTPSATSTKSVSAACKVHICRACLRIFDGFRCVSCKGSHPIIRLPARSRLSSSILWNFLVWMGYFWGRAIVVDIFYTEKMTQFCHFLGYIPCLHFSQTLNLWKTMYPCVESTLIITRVQNLQAWCNPIQTSPNILDTLFWRVLLDDHPHTPHLRSRMKHALLLSFLWGRKAIWETWRTLLKDTDTGWCYVLLGSCTETICSDSSHFHKNMNTIFFQWRKQGKGRNCAI